MATTIRLEDVSHGTLDLLIKSIRIKSGAFILTKNGAVFDIKSEGYESPPTFDEQDIKALCQTHDNIIVFEEIEEGNIKKIMRDQDLSIVAHLRKDGKQIGILILGNKLSGDIYTSKDFNILDILVSEVAVAIQNAEAYEEIRRFNITLQEEVDKATKELQDANVKLQELDKLKDEFVSLASHELRTPMTAIKGSLSTILDGYAGDVSDKSKEFLTAAYNENDRLIRLVNNLLNISRIEAGRMTFTLTKVNLDKLIKETVNNLQVSAKEKNLFLKYEDDGEPSLVLGDEDKIKEILINLIGNAIKFTHNGGVTIAAHKNEGHMVISVADTGHGIAKEDQDLLFKKFSQVQQTYTKQAGGTGLGLYICKQMIEGMKGNIWLESVFNKGSTFYFSIPIAN